MGQLGLASTFHQHWHCLHPSVHAANLTTIIVFIVSVNFADVTLTIGDTYGDDVRVIVVLVILMEADKVADEVTDMEIDKTMVVNITNEQFIGVTLAIGGQISN